MRYSVSAPLRRSLATLVLILVAVPLTLVSTASAAHAGPADLTCVGSETVTYTPPVTFAQKLTHIHGDQTLVSCTSPSEPTITAGTREYDFEAMRSCVNLTDSAGPTFTWEWSDGQTSTMQVNFVNSTLLGQVVSHGTGVVTAGTFEGDAVLILLIGPTASFLDCAGSGIANRTGLVILELTSVL